MNSDRYSYNPKFRKMDRAKNVILTILIVLAVFLAAAVVVRVVQTYTGKRILPTVAGTRYLSSSEYESRIASYQKVLKASPDDTKTKEKLADTYIEYADARAEEGDYDEARKILNDGYFDVQDTRIQDHIGVIDKKEESEESSTGTGDLRVDEQMKNIANPSFTTRMKNLMNCLKEGRYEDIGDALNDLLGL